jgi:hypothetical protein
MFHIYARKVFPYFKVARYKWVFCRLPIGLELLEIKKTNKSVLCAINEVSVTKVT